MLTHEDLTIAVRHHREELMRESDAARSLTLALEPSAGPLHRLRTAVARGLTALAETVAP